MATITRPAPLPGGDGDKNKNEYIKSPQFKAMIDGIKGRGISKLSAASKITIAELTRQKETHHDPRERLKYQKAYDLIARAQLHYCFKLETK